MFKHFERKKISHRKQKSLQELLAVCQKSADFLSFQASDQSPFSVHYINSLVEDHHVHDEILPYLKKNDQMTIADLQQVIPIEDAQIIHHVPDIEQDIMSGHIIIQIKDDDRVLSLPAALHEKRSLEVPETEFTVVGPQEAFIESIDVNLNLIRKRLAIPELVIDEFKVGRLSRNRLAILSIDGITDPQLLQTLTQRIRDADYDEVVDTSQMALLITDYPHSFFPQLLETSRPDRVASGLAEGKVAFTMDGSPQTYLAPANFLEYFSSPDDHYMMWPIGLALRLIRIVALLFSVHATAFYVAVTSYHHELVPDELLDTLVATRIEVPYPPIVEVLLLEVTVELLREAGARLPNRIGQTIGIVGGIVIGTAVVEASLASSVLLIIIGITALASFTAPIYQMGNTIRLIRFPFLVFAQWLGLFGVAVCSLFFLNHLFKLTSLGHPYLAPIYPLRIRDLRDTLIKLPTRQQQLRPKVLRPLQRKRFDPKPRKKTSKDIEE
ncbi:spore germination protein [Natribacillus halophilus]|uniref:GerA spore germination protein n=1 Tax=Natribacillus halophilus TaxID=549003 RepID=A0A1G8RMI0_9BACI|nr:spore germination protein [Natribacillus halophilus]SDJ18146.1 GerA spore germination protein [Natribacillus halophilus]